MGEFKIKKRKKITKRHLRSACAIILAGALLVTSVQNGFVDRTVKADVKKRTEVSVETKKAVELTVVKEIKSERTENSNTYLMSDGSKKLEVYCEDIRYKDSGKWEDYDTSLTDITKSERKELKEATDNASAYRYVNAQGNTKQYFADVIDQENPIIMTNGDYKIEYAPVIEAEKNNNNNITNTESVSLEQIGGESPSQISYQKGGGSVRYDYQSLTNGVKESIILEEKPDSNEFIFDLDLSGMEAKANKNTNEIDLMDKETKDRVAVIAAPNIIDDTGIPTYDYVEYELNSREADNYQLKVVVDTDYLEKASYPLIIDPTYMWITESMIDYRATMSVGGAASSVIARTDSALLMNGTDNQARIYI